MKKKSLGAMIASLRKEKGMTQLEVGSALGMLGIGLSCLALSALAEKTPEE